MPSRNLSRSYGNHCPFSSMINRDENVFASNAKGENLSACIRMKIHILDDFSLFRDGFSMRKLENSWKIN